MTVRSGDHWEGGSGANGALLRAGLVDETSLAISPVVDGSTGRPIVFNSGDGDRGPGRWRA
ncbi:MAG: dihydrofolate reductase family protein [Reyranellaceae bacterium]